MKIYVYTYNFIDCLVHLGFIGVLALVIAVFAFIKMYLNGVKKRFVIWLCISIIFLCIFIFKMVYWVI